jgi:archaellum biogenesis protein FlaJ (TadC family)
MFNDATRLGGEPHEAGERSALLPMSINFLRAKRAQVSASFGMLAIGLHATVVALLTFVVQVIMAFSNIAGSMYKESIEGVESKALEVFALNFDTVQILDYLTKPTLILMSITIAFAAKTTAGGSNYTIFAYLAITLATAGAGMLIVPQIASGFFTPVTDF